MEVTQPQPWRLGQTEHDIVKMFRPIGHGSFKISSTITLNSSPRDGNIRRLTPNGSAE
jgi:hypothetical protein